MGMYQASDLRIQVSPRLTLGYDDPLCSAIVHKMILDLIPNSPHSGLRTTEYRFIWAFVLVMRVVQQFMVVTGIVIPKYAYIVAGHVVE